MVVPVGVCVSVFEEDELVNNLQSGVWVSSYDAIGPGRQFTGVRVSALVLCNFLDAIQKCYSKFQHCLSIFSPLRSEIAAG